MPRAKLQREPCDCSDCRWQGGAPPPPPSDAASAVACQCPPPKSLVVCLLGAPGAADLRRQERLPHLDALTRTGGAGLLACRKGGPSLPLQLLGMSGPGAAPPASLPDRFKQLRAVLLADSAEVQEAGRLAGCYAVHPLGGCPPPAEAAARICKLLQVRPWAPGGAAAAPEVAAALAAVLGAAAAAGPAAGGALDQGEEEGDEVIDMLILVADAAGIGGGCSDGQAGSGSSDAGEDCSGGQLLLEWADALLGRLNQAPGFRDTVLVSLVVGPGQQPTKGQQAALLQEQPVLERAWQGQGAAAAGASPQGQAATADAAAQRQAATPVNPRLRVRRPLQSYQFAGQDAVEVDARRPALVVHRLAGVIRVDEASRYDWAEIQARGAAGCILAERMLPEVAYKLGRAPKYGA